MRPTPDAPDAMAGTDRTLRLLIVEDSNADAWLIQREIGRGGFAVAMTRVTTAAQMRAALRGHTFDLVICDHNLPGSSSDEALVAFREAKLDIPFLIVSGAIGEETAVAAMRAGANDYVLKGRLARLVPAIERELGQAAARKAARDLQRHLAEAQAQALNEATERARVFEVLHEISTASSGVLDVAKLADLTVEGARRLLGGDDAMLRWWDPERKVLHLLGRTYGQDWDLNLDVEPRQSLVGEAFLTRKPVIDNDQQRRRESAGGLKNKEVTAYLAVPLLVADRAVGGLAVSSNGDRRFTEADAQILGLLGAQIGAVIEAARLSSDLVDSLALLEQSQEVGAIGTFVAWLTPEKAGRDEWSLTTIKIFGYTEESYDGTNAAFWKRIHPDDVDRVRAAQAEAHESGSIYDISHRIVRPDGEVRWIHERAVAQSDASGKSVRFLGVTQDITEQELASQALRESAEQFTGAFEGSGIGMALISPEGIYRLVNDALCTTLGRPREELLDKPARSFMHEPDFLPHDGHLIWGRLHVSVILTDGGEIRFYASQLEDITESIAAVAALKESEARNAAVIEATLDAMIVIDAATVVTAFNPAAERMFGYAKDQVIGRDMASLIMPERFHDAHRAGVRRNLKAGRPGFRRRVELVGRRADGSEFPIELSLSRLETDGMPSFSGSIRDLTDRDRLSESQELLARVVGAAPVILLACDAAGVVTVAQGRAIELLGVGNSLAVGANVFEVMAGVPESIELVRRGLAGESFAGPILLAGLDLWLETSYDPIRNDDGEVVGMVALAIDISDRVRGDAARLDSDAKSRLVAIVNHELRTPLNSILGFAELLKLDRVGPLTDKQKRYLDNIESAGRHLLALINDSLDLSKMAAGKMDLEIVPMGIAAIVEEAAEQVQPLAAESGLEIQFDCPEELWVEADRRRVLQILWNLLSNAIRHTPAGGKIGIHCRGNGSAVEIVVIDSGVGMAADQLTRIFEDYSQVGVQADGTGLGLPVSRRLAQLMDGDVQVVSAPGAGSSFTITLPATKAPPED